LTFGFHRKLTEPPYLDAVDWSKWHVFWVDERVVPKDHADSNYKLASDEFLSKVITCTVKFRICFDRERWDFGVSIDLLFLQRGGMPLISLLVVTKLQQFINQGSTRKKRGFKG